MKKFTKDVLMGFKDAIAHARGDKSKGVVTTYTVPVINVKSVRKKTGLTQEAFARLFAIKVRTLQDWEQDRRTPGSAARIFLTIIDQHPSTVKKTLQSMGYSLALDSKKKSAKKAYKDPRKQSTKIVDPKFSKNKLHKKMLTRGTNNFY